MHVKHYVALALTLATALTGALKLVDQHAEIRELRERLLTLELKQEFLYGDFTLEKNKP